MSATMKKYRFETLAMIGQMYDAAGEEANFPSGTHFYLAEDVEKMREALKVTRQALLEVNHAQEVGTSWYTRGESGLRSQVAMWVRKGLDAARAVLESEQV